jgi:hypothetical protein
MRGGKQSAKKYSNISRHYCRLKRTFPLAIKKIGTYADMLESSRFSP